MGRRARHGIQVRKIARRLDYEGENKAQGIKTIPPRPRQVVWTQEQLTAFMAAAERDSECWHSLFTVMAGTGMRRNNVCRMEWSEITGDVWTIPAAKFKTKVKHSVHLTPTCHGGVGGGGAAIMNVGCFHQSRCPTVRMLTLLANSSVSAKRPEFQGVTMHDLRRTLGSRLAARFPIPVVAKILGHKNISTTMSTYAVADDGDARAAMMALAAEQ